MLTLKPRPELVDRPPVPAWQAMQAHMQSVADAYRGAVVCLNLVDDEGDEGCLRKVSALCPTHCPTLLSTHDPSLSSPTRCPTL